MKLDIPASLLTLALTLGGTHIASADVSEKPDGSPPMDRVMEALKESGLDKDTIAEIRKSIEDETHAAETKGGNTNEKNRVITSRKVIIVGPDGKVQSSSSSSSEGGGSGNGDGAGLSIEKIISEAKTAAGKGDGSVKGTGQAVIIGPDGRKKEIKLGEDGNGFEDAIKEAMKDAKVDPNTLDFLSVGPGVLVNPKEDHKDLEKKVDQLEGQIADIQATLKKIEEKLK